MMVGKGMARITWGFCVAAVDRAIFSEATSQLGYLNSTVIESCL